MEKEKILYILNSYINELYEKYGQDRILGVFMCGDVNRGIPFEEGQSYIEAFYLPTLMELCLNKMPEKHYFNWKFEGYEYLIKFVDYRVAGLKLDYETDFEIQSLITDYYICNPRYENLYHEYLRNNADILGDRCHQARARKLICLALNQLEEGDTVNAYKIYYFCSKYIQGIPYRKCMRMIEDPIAMNNLKRTYTLEDVVILKKALIALLKENDKDITEYPDSEILLRTAIEKIMRLAIQDSSNAIKFLKKELSPTEQNIFNYLIENAVNYNIKTSISKLTKELNISRPVFTTLLFKLSGAGIITVENRGSAGTVINFIDPAVYNYFKQ